MADTNTQVAADAAATQPTWLRERRAEAARAFEATPTPTPSLRPWRYTDVTGLDIAAFEDAELAPVVEGNAPEGAYAGSLTGALTADGKHEDLVREHLGSVVTGTEGKFQAANTALWSGGALVYAPRRATFDEPVVVTVDASDLADRAVFPRLLIIAEEQGDVTVVLRLHSGAASLLAAGVVEIIAGQAARVRLLIDDRWGPDTQDFTTIRSRLGRDADVQVATLGIGGRIVKQTIEALLEGEGANSVIRAVALGDDKQHFDFVTLQDHIGPRTTSDVEVKAALAGSSRSVYYGITRVEETAAGGEANQLNKNLLLSEHAKADSDPVLEILTADVIRCGHGATVGPVSAEEMFYLQSRGLTRREALQLLVTGFFQSVLGDIEIEGVADELRETVFAKLAAAEL